MVKDAEAHAEEDRKAVELVTARNQCDAMVHSVKKAFAEYGDKVSAEEKSKIESAIKEAEDAIKSDNKDRIEEKTKTLAEASMKLGEKMYAKEQEAQSQSAQPGAGASDGQRRETKDEGDVVDAEFEEVKEKKG
jgi:molecular chaperone DnaK